MVNLMYRTHLFSFAKILRNFKMGNFFICNIYRWVILRRLDIKKRIEIVHVTSLLVFRVLHPYYIRCNNLISPLPMDMLLPIW